MKRLNRKQLAICQWVRGLEDHGIEVFLEGVTKKYSSQFTDDEILSATYLEISSYDQPNFWEITVPPEISELRHLQRLAIYSGHGWQVELPLELERVPIEELCIERAIFRKTPYGIFRNLYLRELRVVACIFPTLKPIFTMPYIEDICLGDVCEMQDAISRFGIAKMSSSGVLYDYGINKYLLQEMMFLKDFLPSKVRIPSCVACMQSLKSLRIWVRTLEVPKEIVELPKLNGLLFHGDSLQIPQSVYDCPDFHLDMDIKMGIEAELDTERYGITERIVELCKG